MIVGNPKNNNPSRANVTMKIGANDAIMGSITNQANMGSTTKPRGVVLPGT
jgi:hypothetical protein